MKTSIPFNPYENPAQSPYETMIQHIDAKPACPGFVPVANRGELLMLTAVLDRDLFETKQQLAHLQSRLNRNGVPL
jgi:hypothetical protein